MLSAANRAMSLQVFEELGFIDQHQPVGPREDVPPVSSFDDFGEQPVLETALSAAPGSPPRTVSLNEWDAGDCTGLPPPREWLLGNQFCRRFLSGLLAPGATGKTALRTLQYLALATGRPLTGQHVFKRGRVLLLSLEDDDTELRRRLAAARLHHGIEPSELQGWLFCATPKGIKLADVKDGAKVAGPLEAMLRDTIKRRRIDLLGLDPFVKLHALEENDNGSMDFVCDLLVKLAIEFNVSLCDRD